MIPLLQAVLDHAAAPERLKSYARRLLAAFPAPATPGGLAAAWPLPSLCRSGRTPTRADRLESARETAPIEPLSRRELEILRLIAEGWTNQEIAGRLVITLHTVKKHSSNIFG